MTDTLTNIPPTEIGPVTSSNDTSPTVLGREVGVRDLRPGDVIAHEIGLAGRVEIARVTAELAPDLTPWWAVRLTGGTIIPASDDSTFELITAPDRARATPAGAPGAVESFVAPRAMAKLIELANHHRRSYRVGHRCDHYDGNPSVSLTVHWYPHDCDIQTALYLDWHNTSPGRYRLRSASARGYLENHRTLTVAEAERLITGANCFFHGETSPPAPR